MFVEAFSYALASASELIHVEPAFGLRETVRLCALRRPSVVVLPLGEEQRTTTLLAMRSILRTCRDVRVILLTDSDKDVGAIEGLEAGAAMFVSRSRPLSSLVEAIVSVASGRALVFPQLSALIAEADRTRSGLAVDEEEDAIERLSPREREVMPLMCRGLTNKQIADRLSISERTVETYVRGVLHKLGASSRIQAVVFAVTHYAEAM